MKKKNVHTLRLNKKSISNFARFTIKGGATELESCIRFCQTLPYTIAFPPCPTITCPSEDCPSYDCQTFPVQAQGPCI